MGIEMLRCAQHDSIVKARQVMQWMAPVLALGMAGVVPLETIVQRTSSSMAPGCTANSRRKRPAAYQLVDHPPVVRPRAPPRGL